MGLYASVVNNKVIEYPVTEEQIKTRAHSLDMYVEVVETPKPKLPPYSTHVIDVYYESGKVYATYTVRHYTLYELLYIANSANTDTNDFKDPIYITALPEDIIKPLIYAARDYVQSKLDTFVRSNPRNYSSAESCISYLFSKNDSWRKDAEIVSDLRDEIWPVMNQYLQDILSGTKAIPLSLYEIDRLLPIMTWDESKYQPPAINSDLDPSALVITPTPVAEPIPAETLLEETTVTETLVEPEETTVTETLVEPEVTPITTESTVELNTTTE